MPSQNKFLQECNTTLAWALLASIALHVFVLSLLRLESPRHDPALALPLVVHLHPMDEVPRPQPAPTPKTSAPAPAQQQRVAPQQTVSDMPQLVTTTPDTASVQVAPEPAAPAPAPTAQPRSIAREDAPQVTSPEFAAAYLRNTKPRYPASARRSGESGTAVLKVLVTREGLAGRVELESSSGYYVLDQSALETVKRWRFTPAQRGGNPIETWVRVPIEFRLEEQLN